MSAEDLQAASPASKRGVSVGNDSTKPGAFKAHAMAREMERMYREHRGDWKKQSPQFKSGSPRFARTREAFQADYDKTSQDIGVVAETRAKSPNAWAKNAAPQRPPVKRPVCDAVYTPRDVHGTPASKNGSSAFASAAPKYLASPERCPGQDKFSEASTPTKASVGALSKDTSQRFQDAKVVCKAVYDPKVDTITARVEKEKGKKSHWAKSAAPQRPPPAKPLVDQIYDVKEPFARPAGAKSAFVDEAPRFVEPKEHAPPVGLYTSPFISAGMQN